MWWGGGDDGKGGGLNHDATLTAAICFPQVAPLEEGLKMSWGVGAVVSDGP